MRAVLTKSTFENFANFEIHERVEIAKNFNKYASQSVLLPIHMFEAIFNFLMEMFAKMFDFFFTVNPD